MHKKVIVIITFSVLIGVFSVTVSLKDFFFTTKIYRDPMCAYNAGSIYDPTYGDATVKNTIGLFEIDENKALFLGELSSSRFLVAEMNVRDGKYAYEGTAIFYDLSDSSNGNNFNQTETEKGYIRWDIVYNQRDVEKLQNIKSIKEYTLSTGSPLFFIVFE